MIDVQNVTTSDEFEQILTRNFADGRDETYLNRDVVLIRQNRNEKLQVFFYKILNLIYSFVNCHSGTETEENVMQDDNGNYFQKLTNKIVTKPSK